MTSAVLAVTIVRIAGFACSVLAVSSPIAVIVQYSMLAFVAGISAWMIAGGKVIDAPVSVMETLTRWAARFNRPLATS
jgi:lipopolysaccharide export system permease protein